jgi:very-short-patch-repair endonuclease
LHFRRQVPIAHFVVDFACLEARLIVEIDGGAHAQDANAARDRRRDVALSRLGYRVLRFWNSELQTNMDGVVETIFAAIPQTPPASLRSAPSPEREGG